jgi:hypothetical protein
VEVLKSFRGPRPVFTAGSHGTEKWGGAWVRVKRCYWWETAETGNGKHRHSYIVIPSTQLFYVTITLHVSTTKGHPQVSQSTHTSAKLQRSHSHSRTCMMQNSNVVTSLLLHLKFLRALNLLMLDELCASITPALCPWGRLGLWQKWVPGIFVRDKVRLAYKADNFTAICEPTLQKMREPRRLTTLWPPRPAAGIVYLLCVM